LGNLPGAEKFEHESGESHPTLRMMKTGTDLVLYGHFSFSPNENGLLTLKADIISGFFLGYPESFEGQMAWKKFIRKN